MSELKLKYTFQTDNPDDIYEYGNLTRAHQYRRLLSEIFREFREKSRHGNPAGGHFTWTGAYDRLWELAKDENLNPWEDIF